MFTTSLNNGLSRANKAEIMDWSNVDYENAVGPVSSPYVAPSDGLFMWYCYLNTASAVIDINNVRVGAVGGSAESHDCVTYPVSKGDVIVFSASNGSAFYPYKGAE